MKFDELNRLKKDYFEPMAISLDDKERRRELCDYLTDAFLYFFSVYEVHRMHDSMLTKALYEQLLTDRISDAVSKVTGIDSFMSIHIRDLAKEVVDTTIKHVKKDEQVRQTLQPLHDDDSLTALEYESEESLEPLNNASDSRIQALLEQEEEDEEDDVDEIMRQEDNEYWLSVRRAENIAQNESNTFMNYSDFLDAKDRGMKQKTWLTMLDDKVRDSHEEVEGQTVGIDEFFHVGNSEMRFPHDWELSPDPKEVINCRCAVDYK